MGKEENARASSFLFSENVFYPLKNKFYNPSYTEFVVQNAVNPFPNNKILDSSKLKDFADDIIEFDENGNEFSNRVENTVGKGEIARYEQFLLFPQCFKNTYTADT